MGYPRRMLCLRASIRTNTLRHAPPSLRRKPLNCLARMSSSAPNQIIEHVVLFKAKPSADPSAVNAMLHNLNGLATLDSVLHISAGPISRCRSSSLTFTHMLHSRYLSKSHLASYTDDPAHDSVVANYAKPVTEDVMAVDWVAEDFSGDAAVPPGAALRLSLMKMKEEAGESGKREVLAVVRGIKDKFGRIEQLTVGENFSPARAKGFSIASIAVMKGAEELEAETEAAEVDKAKVREFIDDAVVVDYVVPASVQAASL